MQLDQLVDSAIDAIADHLGQVGAQQAGRIADHAVDDLYRVIATRLAQTPTGARVLVGLQQDPAAPAARQRAREVLHDEAQADDQFSRTLREVARWAALSSSTEVPGTTRGNISNRGSGNIAAQAGRDVMSAGRDVKIKRYHIGSIRFGTGGLVGGVALLVSLIGGGTAAVVATTGGAGKSVTVSQAVGTWRHGGTETVNGSVHMRQDPIVLTIAGSGAFDFDTAIHMTVDGASSGQAVRYQCTGHAEADGDHLAFAATSGPCTNFTGTLSADEQP